MDAARTVNQLEQLDEELETILTSFDSSYAWNYGSVKEGLRDLYEKAKRDQWNGTTQLAWSTDVDPERGIREFIVGTGGGGVYEFKRPAANSEVRNNTTYGVLKLTLSPGHYAWEFIPTAGQKFHDDGSAACSPAR